MVPMMSRNMEHTTHLQIHGLETFEKRELEKRVCKTLHIEHNIHLKPDVPLAFGNKYFFPKYFLPFTLNMLWQKCI